VNVGSYRPWYAEIVVRISWRTRTSSSQRAEQSTVTF
jgi:hypothetical protein